MDYSAGDLLIEENSYYVQRKKYFIQYASLVEEDKQECFNFAYEMAYGTGYHRAHRTGSDVYRTRGEIFINTFQGKMAEYALYRYLQEKKIVATMPDTRTFGKGKWDIYDIECQGKHIAVKSTKDRGNLLLLETGDWNENGEYKPNLDNDISTYDYFVLVRLNPDGEKIMKDAGLLLEDSKVPENIYQLLKEIIMKTVWSYDFPGFIYQSEVIKLIREERIIPKSSLLNGRTRMQAENFYFQAGNMHNMNELYQYDTHTIKSRQFLKRICPLCGKELVIRKGPHSVFWGCTGFSKGCKYKEKLDKIQ